MISVTFMVVMIMTMLILIVVRFMHPLLYFFGQIMTTCRPQMANSLLKMLYPILFMIFFASLSLVMIMIFAFRLRLLRLRTLRITRSRGTTLS